MEETATTMSNCIEQDAPTSRIPQSVGPIVHQAEGVKTRAGRHVRRKRGRKGKCMEFAVSGPVVRSVRQRTVSDIGCRARVPRAAEPHHVLPANALRKENRLRSRRGTGGSGSRRNLVCTTRELDVRIRSETVVLPRITFVSPRCTENDGHDGAHSVPVSPSLRPMSTAGLTTGLRHTSAGLDAANAVVQHSLSTREKSAPSRATLPCGARQMVAVSDAADIGIRAAAPVPVAPAALSFGNGPSGDKP